MNHHRAIIPLLLVIPLVFLHLPIASAHADELASSAWARVQPDRSEAIPVYGYRIVRAYPHDPGAFTQGLFYHKGFLYEGTGLNGRSSLRKVDLKTGRVLKIHALKDKYFGEGIACCGKRLIQLTYTSGKAFVYDLEFNKIEEFSYPGEGWGLTCDGRFLIMSDGTATLRWFDAESHRVVREVTVTDRGRPVPRLNELEFAKGEIFANIWGTDRIARIAADTGRVTGWIDLSGLAGELPAGGAPVDVLNGIAYDERGDRLFVTGKFWPKVFEIRLIRKK